MTSAPKRWRQWMPLDVGDFLSSADVVVMTSDEFKGYMMLIMAQWQSEDGYLPTDEAYLRKQSRLTLEQWTLAKPAILDKFELVGTSFSNPRCRKELDKVMYMQSRRTAGAESTNLKRWGVRLANAERSDSVRLAVAEGRSVLSCASPVFSDSSTTLSTLSRGEVSEALKGFKGQGDQSKALTGRDVAEIFPDSTDSTIPSEIRASLESEESFEQSDDSGAKAGYTSLSEESATPPSPRHEHNSPRLREELPSEPTIGPQSLQAELLHPTPPPTTSLALVPATLGGNSASLSMEGWPEAIDPEDAFITLLRAHPRPAQSYMAKTMVQTHVEILARERGQGLWEAYEYLLGKVTAYKAATDKWPASRHTFIKGAVNFIGDRTYEENETIWQGENNDNPREAARAEVIRRKQQRRSSGDADGGPVDDAGAKPQPRPVLSLQRPVGRLDDRRAIPRVW